MKRIKILLVGLISVFLLPGFVNAANASISVKTNTSTVIVGNTVTATVTLSSSESIGSWQFLISYDNTKLKLISGETSVADYTTSASGVKSKSYTLKFQALKSGSASINVGSYAVYAMDESKMNVSVKSANITIKTQAEIEASYSKNAYLKSLNVDGYELNFNKETYEYNLDVENDVEKVNISGSVEDKTAKVNGLGEVSLIEGVNKFQILVTAQKGNTLTYTININRKELDPINVSFNNKEYTIIRKSDLLINYSTFTSSTTTYEDTEIPALVNDKLTLIGLKDSDGNINDYIYENGKIIKKYVELKSYVSYVQPLDLKESKNFSYLEKIKVQIEEDYIEGYKIKNSNNIIIYAYNVESKESDYYLLNTKTSNVSIYDEFINESLNELVTNYKYIIFALLGVIVILIILLIFKRKKTKKEKVKKDKKKKEDNEFDI